MVVSLCCSVLLALAAQDVSVQENATLQLEVRRAANDQVLSTQSQVYQGEILYLDLEISFAADFHDRQLLNPWRMPLDLPVELQLPWAQESEIWQRVKVVAPAGSSLVINRDKSTAQLLTPDQSGRTRFLVQRRIQITTDQEFEIPAASMKVVWATKFEDDLARGMVPLDRQEASIASTPIQLNATALPSQGQPASFKGAVGKFEMKLESELRVDSEPTNPEQAADQDLIWDIEIHTSGRGWLQKDMLATLDELQGFHVQGQRIESTDNGLVLIAELSTTDSMLLPTLPAWSYFNPSSPAAYVTLGPAPTVGKVEEESTDSAQSEESVNSLVAEESSNLQLYWLGIGGAFFIFGMLYLMRRRPPAMAAPSTSGPSSPATRNSVKANPTQHVEHAKAIASKPVRTAVPKPTDFIQQLADHVGCKREQVYSEDFADYLLRADLPQPLQERIQAVVRRIVGAQFRGQGTMPSEDESDSILDELRR